MTEASELFTVLLVAGIFTLLLAFAFPRFFGVLMILQGLISLMTVIGAVIGLIEIVVGFMFIRWGRSQLYSYYKRKLIEVEQQLSKETDQEKIEKLKDKYYKLKMKLAKYEK